MSTLKFANTYNMVAFLSKPTESDGLEQIVDFLNANPIKYALTVNPTIYVSCIEQLWYTVVAKTINGEAQIHDRVDGKKVIISEASIRRVLQFAGEEGVDCLPNSTIFEQLASMSEKRINNILVESDLALAVESDLAVGIGREHERMILESVEHGPLIWPTVKENGVTRTKKYVELSVAKKIQVDCDMKVTNIIIQEQFQVNTKFLNSLPPERSKFVTDVKLVKDLHITNFDQLHAYLEQHELYANKVKDTWLGNALSLSDQGMQHDPKILNDQAIQIIIPNNVAFQTKDLDTYDSDCDDISNAKATLIAIISNYGSDVISEVPHYETYLNDMENQSVHAMQDFEQTPVVDVTDNEIISDSNIILEAYTKEQVDSLEQNLSKQIKENESLLQTFTIFKNKFKEKEINYMENEIDLEKRIKELDNIIFKMGQSAQIVHMLTKPYVFYDNIHKQALGYQNPFYLKKAQRIKPTLYDGIFISAKHTAIAVIDDEETLILEEESRSKMSKKEKDPKAIKQNISHKHIDYEKLNRLSDDFRKHFTPQQELLAE
nr:hypothetical protein [Tanacetum cinerariifolium]